MNARMDYHPSWHAIESQPCWLLDAHTWLCSQRMQRSSLHSLTTRVEGQWLPCEPIVKVRYKASKLKAIGQPAERQPDLTHGYPLPTSLL